MANRARKQGQRQGAKLISSTKTKRTPVPAGLRGSAALRAAGRVLADPDAEAESEQAAHDLVDQVDRAADELDALRDLVRLVVASFTSDGAPFPTGADMVREALKCARDDLELLEHADGPMTFVRAQFRIDVGFALARYLDAFGYPQSAGDREVGAQLQAEQGGAS